MYYYWTKSRVFWLLVAMVLWASFPAITDIVSEAAIDVKGRIREARERRIQKKIQEEFDKIIRNSSK